MPKHKKTRDEKKIADERKLASAITHIHPTYSFVANTQSSALKKSDVSSIHMDTTTVVKNDLVKTVSVSLSILFLQLFFYFLLTHHILAIGFARY